MSLQNWILLFLFYDSLDLNQIPSPLSHSKLPNTITNPPPCLNTRPTHSPSTLSTVHFATLSISCSYAFLSVRVFFSLSTFRDRVFLMSLHLLSPIDVYSWERSRFLSRGIKFSCQPWRSFRSVSFSLNNKVFMFIIFPPPLLLSIFEPVSHCL